ncbi:MAG: hypothetical protein EOL88_06085 [Bacteroidia bacterium]|nr:hypothetical protein [Bacteroidia bacterium]
MRYAITRIRVHTILPVIDFLPLIDNQISEFILQSLHERLCALKCNPYSIKILPDHVHIVHELNPKIALCDVVQNIKGGSSHFVHQQESFTRRFAWNNGSICFSLSSSDECNRVISTLSKQEEYHTNTSINNEIIELIRTYPELLTMILKCNT